MRTFLVTGANRGIGLAITKELGSRGHSIIATVRKPEDCQFLLDVKGVQQVEKLDVVDEASVIQLKEKLRDNKTAFSGIISNAGIFTKRGPNDEDLQSSLFKLSPDLFVDHFKVNTMGPFLVMREFVPLLDASKDVPIVLTIASAMGRIECLKDHRSAHYRVSKCAVHMVTKLFSLEVPECCFINIHPGWVKTDMGSEKAPVTPEESAKGIIDVAESLTLKDSGKFYDYKGQSMEPSNPS